jgi:peptide deformylase
MPVRPIVRLGHPALRTSAAAVPAQQLHSPEVQQLIDDLVDTMRDAQGVGLAAPQVGECLQILVYEVAGDHPPEERVPLRVVVNPMLDFEPGELVYDWEGCLSIPDLRGLVPRHPGVRVRGFDRGGKPLYFVARGFEARVLQHEFDHLNGILYIDRMRSLLSLSYTAEWDAFISSPAEREESTAVG